MKRITAPSVFIIALCAATAAWSQALPRAEPGKVGLSAERLERIEQAFSREIDGGKLPGAVIMVARDGQLAYTKTIGFRDKDANAPLAEDLIFRIYSMTKPMVSVAAMILMEEGRLQLHRSGFEVSAGIRQAPGQRAAARSLRQSDLLDRAGRTADHGPRPAAAHGGPWLW